MVPKAAKDHGTTIQLLSRRKKFRPGKGSINKLAKIMKYYMDLPDEVVSFYVSCRTFFRMRLLNHKIKRKHIQRTLNSKMRKLRK